uniref:Adenylate cyclase type 8 n=1 Tax=Larimichthys crocea TaxID=215358 RepID=A0A0F8BN70_LARCR
MKEAAGSVDRRTGSATFNEASWSPELPFDNIVGKQNYSQMRDEVFKSNLVCAFIVLIFITTIQSLLPSARMVTMVIQFSVLIVLHSCLVLVTTAEDYKCLPLVLRKACCWINETYAARNVIVFVSILINFLAAMINILWCDFDKSSTFRNQTYNESASIPDICFYPEYFVFTGVLAMVTCAVFLRLNSVLKLAVLLVMIAIYSLLTEAFYTSLFVRYDTVHHNTENFLGTKETSLLLMAMFLLAVFYHGQQQCEDKWGHLCALADFAIALNESIQEINKHSFNNFELRIGKSSVTFT